MIKDKTIRVLVTDGNYKHTLGAVRSLARADFLVDVIGSRNCLSSWSRYLYQLGYSQKQFNEKHIDKFINFLSNSHYNVLLPIGARSVQLVSRHRNEIEKYCAIPLASQRAIELCLNKDEIYQFAAGLSVKVPQTWVFTGVDELQAKISKLVFPVVIKGKSEIRKDRPLYANNADQLLNMVAIWGQGMSSEVVSFPIIQQYIDGVAVGFFALYQNGQCKRVFMHQRVREIPPSGGPSCCAVSIYESDLLVTGRKLLDALEWHGIAMVEFKRERNTGGLYLMEVNPKFWGSLDLALSSGVDFPVLDVCMALGEDIPYSEDYRIGLRFHWPLDGEISHIRENPKAIFSVLLDCIDPRTKSNVCLNDPLPIFNSLYSEARRFGSWILKKFNFFKILNRTRSQGLRIALVRIFSEVMGIPLIRYSQITSQIYIGSQYGIMGKRKLEKLGITGIVNLRKEFDDNAFGLVIKHYCHLPIAEFTSPTIEQLEQGIAFIKQIVNDGKVYIHCSEGVSRAPVMAIAYLISQGIYLSEAINLTKQVRPFINILPVQMERLRQFEIRYKKSGK